jgi:hypothetical protein
MTTWPQGKTIRVGVIGVGRGMAPWPDHAGPGQPPPSLLGRNDPGEQALAHIRQVWQQIGYRGE